MYTVPSNSPNPFHNGSNDLRTAVLEAFSQSSDVVAARLARFADKQWSAHLRWLDTSGLALYLLGHLRDLHQTDVLPAKILSRLEQNLADNTIRNAGLLGEAREINVAFQRENIRFVYVKGATLSPASVPDPNLRCQLDLDFLVFADHGVAAAEVLERRGYRLDCISGQTWEFIAGNSKSAKLKDLYKSKPQRSADLHLVPESRVLDRVQIRSFDSTPVPVLSPPDVFTAQALHLFKHLRSPFTRAAWLLEFHRHTCAHQANQLFWMQLEDYLQGEPESALALGVSALLAAEVFGDTPPNLLSRLVSGSVPPAVQLWVRLYGRTALLADFPGTKLYLLLQKELDAIRAPFNIPHSRRAAHGSPKIPAYALPVAANHQRLLPAALPRMITHAPADEALGTRARRISIQCGYVLSRTLFHAVEGLRYLRESSRFRRLLSGFML